MSHLYWMVTPPYFYLILGPIIMSIGVYSTITGEAPTRVGPVYRAQKPGEFWFAVAIWYLAGAGCIGYGLYKFCMLSH